MRNASLLERRRNFATDACRPDAMCHSVGTSTRYAWIVKRMERVRPYPTPSQAARLVMMLDVTRQLYNAFLQNVATPIGCAASPSPRRCNTQSSRHREALRRELIAVWRVISRVRGCNAAAARLAMQAFFRRVKRGEKAGYPRFRSRSRWPTLQFPHGERALGSASFRRR